MTKEEFEKRYARKSRTTVEKLRQLELVACPCNCGEEDCVGWQMKTRRLIETEEKFKNIFKTLDK